MELFSRGFLASRCWVVEVVGVGMWEGVMGVVCAGLMVCSGFGRVLAGRR